MAPGKAKHHGGTQTTQGNGNPIQFGLGVQMNSVNQNFSQSSFQSTGNALDMALQGNGFFTLKHKFFSLREELNTIYA